MTRITKQLFTILLLLFVAPSANAQFEDFWRKNLTEQYKDNAEDQKKTVEELVREAITIMREYPLSARNKLLVALKKRPDSVIVLNLLGRYYNVEVGHFRLAIKYMKKAEQELLKQNGEPPYFSERIRLLHSEIIRNLSMIRQNLDNYQGALETIEEYEKLGYTDPYLASSKAWILFKLKRYPEAIQIAEKDLADNPYSSQVLNVLGILYSVTGQRDKSIKTLALAYEKEMMMGNFGQPATPLNNLGEVLRETFRESQAKQSWEKAINMHDGCEHILPSFNLAIVNIEALQLKAAKQAVKNFQRCYAQFTLRNNEEHQALIHILEARISYYSGNLDQAVDHLKQAIERQQWFGKIGTHIEDLQASIYSFMALVLEAQINKNEIKPSKTFQEKLQKKFHNLKLLAMYKWYIHKAKITLINKLDNFEDSYFRNSDSMLDYSSLGFVFQHLPAKIAEQQINKLKQDETRKPANSYYDAYLSEALLNSDPDKAKKILKNTAGLQRSDFDAALQARALLLLLSKTKLSKQEEKLFTRELIRLSPSLYAYTGRKVKAYRTKDTPKELLKQLSSFVDFVDVDYDFTFNYSIKENKHRLTISRKDAESVFLFAVSDQNIDNLADKTFLTLFSEKL